jgi:hypothetical protein
MKQILPNWGLGLEVIGAGYLKISFGTASVNLVIGIIAYAYVRKRQKTLDGLLMEKINKQLSSGL